MIQVKHLKTGEFSLGFADDVLTTDGVGSCVVICLWCPQRKVGAMAHMRQARRGIGTASSEGSIGLSPDSAVPYLVGLMLGLGVQSCNITIRLVGAGNMFIGVQDGSAMDVGKDIMRSTLFALNALALPLKSQSIGGSLGRSVNFNVDSGLIRVGFTNGSELLL